MTNIIISKTGRILIRIIIIIIQLTKTININIIVIIIVTIIAFNNKIITMKIKINKMIDINNNITKQIISTKICLLLMSNNKDKYKKDKQTYIIKIIFCLEIIGKRIQNNIQI